MRTLSTKIIDKRLSMVHGMEGLVPYVQCWRLGWTMYLAQTGWAASFPPADLKSSPIPGLTRKLLKFCIVFVYDTDLLSLGISDFIRDWQVILNGYENIPKEINLEYRSPVEMTCF